MQLIIIDLTLNHYQAEKNKKGITTCRCVSKIVEIENKLGHVTVATPISGTAQKYFLRDVKGKLCSKFGEDRSKTE